MLHTDPNTRPKPYDPRRCFCQNAAAVQAGAVYSRATIFAPSIDQLSAAVDYFTQNNRPGMNTEARIDRAIYLAQKFDAEAQHLLFATNPDHADHADN